MKVLLEFNMGLSASIKLTEYVTDDRTVFWRVESYDGVGKMSSVPFETKFLAVKTFSDLINSWILEDLR